MIEKNPHEMTEKELLELAFEWATGKRSHWNMVATECRAQGREEVAFSETSRADLAEAQKLEVAARLRGRLDAIGGEA